MLVPVLSLAVRINVPERRVLVDNDNTDYLPIVAICIFCLMICGTSSFILAGSPRTQRRAELPDLTVQGCCCYQTERKPGLVQYFSSFIFCALCCTCDSSGIDNALWGCNLGSKLNCNEAMSKTNRDPTYPWAFDKDRTWWFPFFFHAEQMLYALYREFLLFKPDALADAEK